VYTQDSFSIIIIESVKIGLGKEDTSEKFVLFSGTFLKKELLNVVTSRFL
jgi:hypothetical protein